MLSGILLLIICTVFSMAIITSLKRKYAFVDDEFLRRLYFYHLLMSFLYYLFALFNPSDSKFYYKKVLIDFRGDDWFSFYGTSTTFIEFIGYPFIKFLGFSYEASMCLFSFFGFLGFLFFYILFKENIRFKHTFLRIDLLTLIFFLPNFHFWSASFGKGSVIFMGVGMFFFAISKLHKRWFALIVGALIIYHVRPHIMLVILVSSAIGFVFTSKDISWTVRIVFLLLCGIAFFYIYQDVLQMIGIDEEELLAQGLDLSKRASELSKATSGVNISDYNLLFQMFTFLYRPLFFDAPGVLGLIVSVENVFYLLLTLRVFSLDGLKFALKSNFLIKTAFFSFLTSTIALAQISGNLGLAIRQKSQIMILFMFVLICYLDFKKFQVYTELKKQQIRKRIQDENYRKALAAKSGLTL